MLSIVYFCKPLFFYYKIASRQVIASWKTPEDRKLLKETILKDSKIASFVQASNAKCDDFSLPFVKPRSWAQYGEEQYGVCFAFSKSALLNNIKKEFSEIKLYEDLIKYDIDTSSRSSKDVFTNKNQSSIYDAIYSHIDEHKNDTFFRKYKDFTDENEYRIALVDKSKERRQYLFSPIEGAFKAVILGERFHKGYHQLVNEHCQSYSAKAFTLEYATSPYIKELKTT